MPSKYTAQALPMHTSHRAGPLIIAAMSFPLFQITNRNQIKTTSPLTVSLHLTSIAPLPSAQKNSFSPLPCLPTSHTSHTAHTVPLYWVWYLAPSNAHSSNAVPL